MARAGRHAAPHTPTARRALLRASLAVTAAGLAIGAAGTAASAADGSPAGSGGEGPGVTRVLTDSLGYAVAPLTDLPLDPLAGTGTDPLDNGLATQVADFKPVSTQAVTGILSNGGSLSDVPLLGQATGMLTK